MTMLPMEPAKKLGLVIDLDICVGCHACAVTCKEWKSGGYGNALSDQAPYGEDPAGTCRTGFIHLAIPLIRPVKPPRKMRGLCISRNHACIVMMPLV